MKLNLFIAGTLTSLTIVSCNQKLSALKPSDPGLLEKPYGGIEGETADGKKCNIEKITLKAQSQTEYTNMLCDRLSNHALNNSCAEDIRKREFLLNCAGKTWKDSAEAAKKETSPNSKVDETPSVSVQDKIKNELQFLVVKSTKLAEGILSSQLQYAQQFQEEVESCNTGYLGPWCPTHQLQSVESELISKKSDKEEVLLVEVKRTESINVELYVFKVSTEATNKSISFELYQEKQERTNSDTLTHFYEQKTNLVKLLDMSLERVTIESALEILKNPKSLRHLQSGAVIYRDLHIQNNLDSEQIAKTVLQNIMASKALFGTSDRWQDEMEALIIAKVNGATESDISAIAFEMKKSNIAAVKQLSAVTILTQNSKAENEIRLTWEALAHESAVVRANAIKALMKTSLTSVDKIKLLEMLKDVDGEVSQTAIEGVESMKLDQTHVPILAQLYEIDNPAIKQAIISAMKKINSPEANDFIKIKAAEDLKKEKSTTGEEPTDF